MALDFLLLLFSVMSSEGCLAVRVEAGLGWSWGWG